MDNFTVCCHIVVVPVAMIAVFLCGIAFAMAFWNGGDAARSSSEVAKNGYVENGRTMEIKAACIE